MSSANEMRVGVLAKPMVLRWQETALERVAALDGVSIEHVVVDASLREDSSTVKAGADVVNRGRQLSLDDLRLFFDVYDDMGLKAFLYADRKLGWLLFGEESQMEHLQSDPVESIDVLADATHHDCEPVSAGGAWNTLPEDITTTLGEDCDVLIRFGFGLLKGPVLGATEHGVLSTHGSDIREYRGLGPKVTFLNDEEVASVTLQQLTEDIDGGKIVEVATRELPQPHAYVDVIEAIHELQSEVFATGIEKLQSDEFEPWEPDELGTYHGHKKQKEEIGFVGRLLLKNNLRRLRKLGTRLRSGEAPAPSGAALPTDERPRSEK